MKNDNISISAIVPMYNAEKFVDGIVPCLMNQTQKDIEIILVNDGSTDNTLAKLHEYANKDSRIRIIDKKNCGVSEARNSGMDIAKGEYIWFIDADDFVFPECGETMYRECGGRDFVITEYVRATDRNTALETKHIVEPTERIVANNIEEMKITPPFVEWIGVIWRCLYKREIIEKYNLRFRFTRMSHQDTLWNYEYLSHCNSCVRSNYEGYVYMHTPDSLCQQNTRIVKKEWFPVAKKSIEAIFNRFEVNEKSLCSKNFHFQYASNCATFAIAGYLRGSELPYKERMARWRYLLNDEWWMMQNRYGLSSKIILVNWIICRFRLFYIADPLLKLWCKFR